jgi:iron uptake system component EfeO
LVKQLDQRFEELDTELNQHQAEDGSWTFYDKLTKEQVRKLSDVVAALSEPISHVASAIAKSEQP